MEKLKIPKESKGISKTFRIPENLIEDMEALSEIKKQSLNRISIYLLRFSLENLNIEDKEEILKVKRKKVKGETR